MRFGIFLFLLFVPLLNKLLFSLVIWDLLPIRIVTISLGAISLLRLYQWWKDPDFKLKIKKDKVKKFFQDQFLLILLILWIVRLVSFIKAENIRQSVLLLGFYSSMIFLYGFLKYVYAKYRKGIFYQHLGFYRLLGVITSIYALVQVVLVKRGIIMPGVWAIPGHTPRVGSTFWDVNHFAAFILSIIPLSLVSLIKSKNRDQKILNLITPLLLLLTLFFTGSRSAWLGLGMMVVVVFLYTLKNNFRALFFYLLSLVVVLSLTIPTYIYLKGESPTKMITNYMNYRSESFGAHMWLLQGAGEIFVINPIIGGGYGNFDENFRKTEIWKHYSVRDALPSDIRIPSHSIWGEVLAETGALGFIFYLTMMIMVLSRLMKAISVSKNKNNRLYSLAFLSSIVGLLTAGIFYTYNLEFFWLMIFWGVIHARRILA